MNHDAIRRLAGALLCLACLRCASAPAPAGPGPGAGAGDLIAADEAFARTAEELGLAEAFASWAAPDATMMPVDQKPVTGRDEVRKQFADFPADMTLSWKPFKADIAKSGDLGYTLGTYELKRRGAGGEPVVSHGKYCSVWKKQADGSWKWVVDIGNSSPAP